MADRRSYKDLDREELIDFLQENLKIKVSVTTPVKHPVVGKELAVSLEVCGKVISTGSAFFKV